MAFFKFILSAVLAPVLSTPINRLVSTLRCEQQNIFSVWKSENGNIFYFSEFAMKSSRGFHKKVFAWTVKYFYKVISRIKSFAWQPQLTAASTPPVGELYIYKTIRYT